MNLEIIAYHASRIAWMSMDLSGPFTDLNPDQEALLDLEPALRGLIEKSISSLLMADAERANQVIEKAGDILKAVNFTVVSPGIRGADDGLAWLTAASTAMVNTRYHADQYSIPRCARMPF